LSQNSSGRFSYRIFSEVLDLKRFAVFSRNRRTAPPNVVAQPLHFAEDSHFNQFNPHIDTFAMSDYDVGHGHLESQKQGLPAVGV
jgi:hypothetical protein